MNYLDFFVYINLQIVSYIIYEVFYFWDFQSFIIVYFF